MSWTGAARPIRLGAGLSLGEVAESVGVSPSTILRWENRERAPRGQAAVAYGRLLAALIAQQRPSRRVPEGLAAER
ncbi:MAG: helix-turn-helix domain-containing protein [Candidatus Limnocylindria bacterium]